MENPTLLITGAAGNLGGRVVELLLEAEVPNKIIAATRDTSKLTDVAARGVETRKADFDDEDGLIAAFTGADRVLIVSTDSLQGGKRLEQHLRAVSAAKKAGVKHVVYTSLANAGPDSPVSIAPDHYGTEQGLAESGLSYTSLRNNLYANLLVQTISNAIKFGKLVAAAGEGGASYITRDDCARAAAAALTSAFDGKRILEISGPDVVTHADLAHLATEIAGKHIPYVAVTPDEMRGVYGAVNLPPVVVEMLVSFEVATATGNLAVKSDAFQYLTGKEPERTVEFLREHRSQLMA